MLTKYLSRSRGVTGPGPATAQLADPGPVTPSLRSCPAGLESTPPPRTDSLSLVMTSSHRSVSSQLLTVLAVSFGPFSVGLSKGYSSPALASLAASNLGVTDQQTSWLASLSLLGALLGGLTSSLVLRAGRKNSLLLVSLPFSASWMLTVFATNVEMMFCTAFTAGLCSAIVIVVSQVSSMFALKSLRSDLRI